MDKMTIGEILRAVEGTLLAGREEAEITGVTIDNRTAGPGDIFFAIVGEVNNGHRFAVPAMAAGAAAVMVSEPREEILAAAAERGTAVILVQDTSLALGDMARAYRSKYAVPVVAITGSVGKTTAKDLIASVLSEGFRVLKTPANKNNNFGLPLTIFSFDHTYDMMVLEMGMNHFGEIEYLTKIGLPDVAVITNVGDAHIGNLGSREGILQAKSEIFLGMKEGGTAVLNGDDVLLLTLKDSEKVKGLNVLYAGTAAGSDYYGSDLAETDGSVSFTAHTPRGSFSVEVPAPGAHMVYPAMNAIAVGEHFGLSNEQICAGIRKYEAARMPKEELAGGRAIYNDTYNASPQSMMSSLHVLSAQLTAKKAAVLGDMLEQGAHEEKLHRAVGAYAAGEKIDALICIGPRAAYIADEAAKNGLTAVTSFATLEEAIAALEAGDLPALTAADTAVLFKASHSMGLGKMAAALKTILQKEA